MSTKYLRKGRVVIPWADNGTQNTKIHSQNTNTKHKNTTFFVFLVFINVTNLLKKSICSANYFDFQYLW